MELNNKNNTFEVSDFVENAIQELLSYPKLALINALLETTRIAYSSPNNKRDHQTLNILKKHDLLKDEIKFEEVCDHALWLTELLVKQCNEYDISLEEFSSNFQKRIH
ncbi:hypothetical protein OAW69_03120 [Gammaproteobacteria bacterium]|jgi:hypothetical protein|nr:hypothetical protein [Gammaproteobacteria bacterium]